MKFLKNKFIFSILFLILLILWIETYSFYSIIDTNSYVSLVSWTWFLDGKNLLLQKREVLKVWNTIKTVWEESLAVIEWWDNSITRLGWNTEIYIKENTISDDLSKIQISLNLVNWKTWNNLVSLFWKDSYFKLYVDDVDAWVRWTIFEINKDKDYVYVENHEITLKNNKTWEEITVWENKPFSLKTFSLLELQEFLLNLKDKTWENLNKKLDNELLKNLKTWITNELEKNNPIYMLLWIFSKKYSVLNDINSFENLDKVKTKITKLNQKDKKYIYDKVFSRYQNINFLSSSDTEYDKKLYYKEILLQTYYDEKNNESLIKNSLYDINDMISSNDISKLKESVNVLVNNKDIVKSLNIDFNKYVDLSSSPLTLKDSLIKWLEPLEEILNINFNLESLLKLEEKASNKLNELLEDNIWPIIDSIKK